MGNICTVSTQNQTKTSIDTSTEISLPSPENRRSSEQFTPSKKASKLLGIPENISPGVLKNM